MPISILKLKAKTFKLFIVIALFFTAQNTFAQNPVNWTSKQLITPADLANGGDLSRAIYSNRRNQPS